MKSFKHATLASALLFAFVGNAPAQFNRLNYEPGSVSALIDRVHSDLNRAYGAWQFSGGDRKRLNHAEKELRDFSGKWNRGRFDKGELDDAISSVQHVLDNNHLPPGERRALSEDLDQLRGMRESYDRHEIGYRR
jgi:hypothetical protein